MIKCNMCQHGCSYHCTCVCHGIVDASPTACFVLWQQSLNHQAEKQQPNPWPELDNYSELPARVKPRRNYSPAGECKIHLIPLTEFDPRLRRAPFCTACSMERN